MGKKYIVEIGYNEVLYKTMITNDGKPYIGIVNGKSYTEPDLEQVRKAAYEKGFGAGYSKYLNKSYEDGLKDAWEAAKKIALMDTETSENVTGYFGLFRIMENLTPMQAIEKIRQYEQEHEKIKRGDEVITQSGETIIVTHRLEDDDLGWLDGMGLDGRVYSFLEKNCTKTGKHYSEIAEFFRKMGEKNG